ncbi:MAG: hypothetical protein U0835_19520 [Isosphaeraceae bacterium]
MLNYLVILGLAAESEARGTARPLPVKPTLGIWLELLRSLAGEAAHGAEAYPIDGVPEILLTPAGEKDVVAVSVEAISRLLETDPVKKKHRNALSMYGLFIHVRNRVHHRRLRRSRYFPEVVRRLEEAVDEHVKRLAPLADWPPVAYLGVWTDGRPVFDLLRGPATEFPQVEVEGAAEWVSELRQGDVLLCREEGGKLRRRLPLSHLARYVTCETCNLDGLFMYSGSPTRGQAEYTHQVCGQSVRLKTDALLVQSRAPSDDRCPTCGQPVPETAPAPVPAAVPAPATPHAAIPAPLTMTVRVTADVFDPTQDSSVMRAVEPGVVLEEFDGVKVEVELDRDAHFALLLRDGLGGWTTLFPADRSEGGSGMLRAFDCYAYPENEGLLVLGAGPGVSTLVFLADESPVALDEVLDAVADCATTGRDPLPLLQSWPIARPDPAARVGRTLTDPRDLNLPAPGDRPRLRYDFEIACGRGE